MYKPKHFEIYELVPQKLYEEYAERDQIHKLWLLFDGRILLAADIIREIYGKMTINNWWWGGDRDEAGWRFWDTLTGARLSQHKFGRALDPILHNVTADEVRHRIINREICNGLVTRVEDRVSWLHIDSGIPEDSNEIQVVVP
jgi:hypothetical protein